MEAIVKEIEQAKSSIRIQAYSFTNQSLGQALLAANKKGIKIEVILDRENLGNPHSLLWLLHEVQISIYLDDKHQIAHNKIMIIDSSVVITGSANFTKAGDESNAENSLIIRDNKLAARYITNWQLHKEHSPRFNP